MILVIGIARAQEAYGLSVEEDLYLGVWSPYASTWQTEIPICIWSEEGDFFRITASGLAPGRKFSLTNNLQQTVPYKVFLLDGKRFRRRERLRQNVPSRRIYPSAESRFCHRGYTARVRVKLNKKQIDRAVPAIYSDTLLLILSPL